MAEKFFNIKLTKAELRKIFTFKKMVIVALGALATYFVILAPFQLPWDGWNVIIAAWGGMFAGAWLE